jgi:hypothetical protein
MKKDELEVSGEECGVKQDSSDDDFRLYDLCEKTFSTISFSVYLHKTHGLYVRYVNTQNTFCFFNRVFR